MVWHSNCSCQLQGIYLKKVVVNKSDSKLGRGKTLETVNTWLKCRSVRAAWGDFCTHLENQIPDFGSDQALIVYIKLLSIMKIDE